MRTATLSRWFCLFFAVLGISGCAHQASVSITSNKLDAYKPNLQRLLVVTDLSQVMKIQRDDQEALFEASFMASLGGCGITVKFHRHDPLALNNEELGTINEFHPDTVMTIQLKSGTTYGGVPTSFHMEGSILDWGSKRQVWKAEIDSAPGYYAGQNLAAMIVANLKDQAILRPACVTPEVPKL